MERHHLFRRKAFFLKCNATPEWLELKGSSGDHAARQGHPEQVTGTRPGGFRMSPERKTPRPPWAGCHHTLQAPTTAQENSFNYEPAITSLPKLQALQTFQQPRSVTTEGRSVALPTGLRHFPPTLTTKSRRRQAGPLQSSRGVPAPEILWKWRAEQRPLPARHRSNGGTRPPGPARPGPSRPFPSRPFPARQPARGGRNASCCAGRGWAPGDPGQAASPVPTARPREPARRTERDGFHGHAVTGEGPRVPSEREVGLD